MSTAATDSWVTRLYGQSLTAPSVAGLTLVAAVHQNNSKHLLFFTTMNCKFFVIKTYTSISMVFVERSKVRMLSNEKSGGFEVLPIPPLTSSRAPRSTMVKAPRSTMDRKRTERVSRSSIRRSRRDRARPEI